MCCRADWFALASGLQLVQGRLQPSVAVPPGGVLLLAGLPLAPGYQGHPRAQVRRRRPRFLPHSGQGEVLWLGGDLRLQPGERGRRRIQGDASRKEDSEKTNVKLDSA